jgi:hypothetical protein
MGTLTRAGKVVVGIVPAAQLARLGPPALISFFAFAVLVLVVICWIIRSQDRCERVSRILLALRGNSAALTSGSGTATTPVPGPHPRRAWPWKRRSRSGQGNKAHGTR